MNNILLWLTEPYYLFQCVVGSLCCETTQSPIVFFKTRSKFNLQNEVSGWAAVSSPCRVTSSSCFPTSFLSNDHCVLCEVDPFPPPVLVTASPPLMFVIPSTHTVLFHAAAECRGPKQGLKRLKTRHLFKGQHFTAFSKHEEVPGPAHTVGFRLILPLNLPW